MLGFWGNRSLTNSKFNQYLHVMMGTGIQHKSANSHPRLLSMHLWRWQNNIKKSANSHLRMLSPLKKFATSWSDACHGSPLALRIVSSSTRPRLMEGINFYLILYQCLLLTLLFTIHAFNYCPIFSMKHSGNSCKQFAFHIALLWVFPYWGIN